MADDPEARKERDRIVALIEARIDSLRERQMYPPSWKNASEIAAKIDELNRTLDAITGEDVRRLAPTAGFYWIGNHPNAGPGWFIGELKAGPGRPRLWYMPGAAGAYTDEDIAAGRRIIGPLTPPEAP